MRKALKFLVSGYVQGVGYRYFTINIANKIGVSGYVKNLHNGNVEVYAIGTEEQLEELHKYLEMGPSHSRVDEVIIIPELIDTDYYNFRVEH